MSKQSDIKVVGFDIPEDSLYDVVVAWRVSRSEEPAEDIVKDVYENYTQLRLQKELAKILLMDLPIREFIPVFFVVEGAPRAFWDQLDRHRVGFAFWEQSLRIQDFSDKMNYFVPSTLDGGMDGPPELYRKTMKHIQQAYKYLAENVPREDARGVLPLHVITRGSVQTNLRALLNMLSSRTCFSAQSTYWKPVVNGILEGLSKSLPELMNEGILKLPCDGRGSCPFVKDVMERLNDKANPICPILVSEYLPKEYNVYDVVNEMLKAFPNYVDTCLTYVNSIGRRLDYAFFLEKDKQ